MLVFATGFDAVDGNYVRIDIRGRDGQSINEHWSDGPTSYLGVATSGFPNMFMILGPNGPFTNLPPTIETQVEWIADTIGHVSATETGWIDVKPETETDWTDTCCEIADATLFAKVDSWIFGANIPGKKQTVMFYLGGLGRVPQDPGSRGGGRIPQLHHQDSPAPGRGDPTPSGHPDRLQTALQH